MKNPFINFFSKKETQSIQGFSSVFNPIDSDMIYALENSDISRKIWNGYHNKLPYGNSGIQNIINYRRSWIIGNDISVTSSEAEHDFVEYLDSEFKKNLIYQKIATFSEIEGKCLIAIKFKKDPIYAIKPMPFIVPYNSYGYRVELDSYGEIVSINYTQEHETKTLYPEQYVLINYNMLSNDPALAIPNIAYIVNDLIDIDKALSEWRQINDRFAKTTPIFEVDDWNDAKQISSIIKNKPDTYENKDASQTGKRWKVGEGIAIKGRAKALEFSTAGIDSLKSEIINRSQKASGHSGIPIFLLGFPELMSNRATASEMVEMIINKTTIERRIIETKLYELYEKYINIYNEQTGSSLNPKSIKITIPVVSQNEINNLVQYFEPLYANKIISKKTFRELLPGVDPELEEERELEERQGNEILNNNAIESIVSKMNQTGEQNANNS